jgi:hypothetical protein
VGVAQSWWPIEQEEAPAEQALPVQADAQGLWGNSFLGSWFGGGDQQPLAAKAGLGELVEAEVDELKARQELADKFDTENPLGSPGKAAVTPEQFDEIVKTYSEIRRGKTNLTFDTSGMTPEQAAAFESGSMQDIAKLMQTESGRQMLSELAYNDKGLKTTIGGLGGGGPHADGSSDGLDCQESNANDRMGDPGKWCTDDRSHDGKGVNTRVEYRPGETEKTEDGDIRSDVVLYHELAHALHNERGDQARGVVSDDFGKSVGADEFQAAGLGDWAYQVGPDGNLVPNENLYRSERRDLGEDVDDRPSYGGVKPKKR